MIAKEPLYYTEIAEQFADYDFQTVARALGHLHATEKLWQDPRGRMCVRGSKFAAKPPGAKMILPRLGGGGGPRKRGGGGVGGHETKSPPAELRSIRFLILFLQPIAPAAQRPPPPRCLAQRGPPPPLSRGRMRRSAVEGARSATAFAAYRMIGKTAEYVSLIPPYGLRSQSGFEPDDRSVTSGSALYPSLQPRFWP